MKRVGDSKFLEISEIKDFEDDGGGRISKMTAGGKLLFFAFI